ncbi:M24 family metallopeptidase [Cryobacterium sp. TMT2-4]|nr:M24 family metallopeptidase [Cryobacterium sp. TMT2-4]
MTVPAAPTGLPWQEQLSSLGAMAHMLGVDTVVLSNPLNLSWFTGARWHVPQTLSPACFDVIVTDLAGRGTPSVRIVTNTIEAPRLRDTEFVGSDVVFDTVPWDEDRARLLPSGSNVARDASGTSHLDASEEIAALRRILTTEQSAQIRELSRDTARITGAVAAAARPGETEQRIAGRLVAALLEEGIECVALFVGSDERISEHRHPLATAKTIEDRIMVACCGRRSGVVASVTRMVAFSPLGTGAETYRRLLEVERGFLDASVPGAQLAEVFAKGVAGYASHGFDSDEWRRHHQGGLTGFNPRELIANMHSELTLQSGMALGWNPSAAGFKVEDTTLVTPSGAETLGDETAWPTIRVGGRIRPAVLELH